VFLHTGFESAKNGDRVGLAPGGGPRDPNGGNNTSGLSKSVRTMDFMIFVVSGSTDGRGTQSIAKTEVTKFESDIVEGMTHYFYKRMIRINENSTIYG
jgi:hypothetical protein